MPVGLYRPKYGINELEVLGVVWVLRHFRAYRWGHNTIVYTDHLPMKSLLYAKHTSGKLARWSQVVSEYDLEIRYRPGRQNANTGALSRSPLPGETDIDSLDTVQIATITMEGDVVELAKQQREDTDLEPIILSLENGKQEDNFALVDNVLYHCGNRDGNPLRLCVLKVDRKSLLKDAHSGIFAGHF